MTKRKELPIIMPSIHTFAITGRVREFSAKACVQSAMRTAVQEGQYKWMGPNTIVKKGGGLQVALYSKPSVQDFHYILFDNINLPRLGGDGSYLALTDLSEEGLYRYQAIFEEELKTLGVPWRSDNIQFSLRRLDLAQDFYVKSDPSLIIRNLRFAGENGLFRGISAKHFTKHNEKHSAKWEYRWYNVTVYDKHAEIQNRNKNYRNVPETDITMSKNRLRYELSLKREFLRGFERNIDGGSDVSPFGIEYGIKTYFLEISRVIPTILRNIASGLFGEYAWQRIAYVQEALDFARSVGAVEEMPYRITQKYLNCLNASKSFKLTSANEIIIKEVLDQLGVNRIVIPDYILTKREYCRFPCYPPANFVQGEGESIDFMCLPERSWKKNQRIYKP